MIYDAEEYDVAVIGAGHAGCEAALACSRMGLKTVIEGVETKEQIDFLKNNNCFNIQGYYFDKPLCSFEFENKLKNKYYDK